MIIDCHVHILPTAGESLPQAVAHMLGCMDRLGLAQACLSLGDRLLVQPTAEEVRESNEWVARAVALAPDRIIGFVYGSPNHPEASLQQIEQHAVHGPFRGIKLWVCQLADHAGNDPICARAAQLGLPVLQHTWFKATGNLPTESEPRHLLTLAQRHPQTNFIMAHAGGDWERGLRTVRNAPNVYPDTCGNDPEAGFTELAVRLLGAERIVFGSDATGRSFGSQMAKVTGADISDEAKRLILGGNLLRLMQG
ncbi:MAG: amidohydrolase family protein [Armatimonadota bacterium]